MTTQPPPSRTGCWTVGSLGSLATTAVVGARLVASGRKEAIGLATERPEFQHLGLIPLSSIHFGGHEVRKGTLEESARRIASANHSIPADLLPNLRPDLEAVDARIRPGLAVGCGQAIEAMDEHGTRSPERLREVVERLESDLRGFAEAGGLEHLVVVNLASTEPPVDETQGPYSTLAQFEAALDQGKSGDLRPGALYAYAAFRAGAAYVNFTPSGSCLCPALRELAVSRGLPFAGNDGKTGETLVKSALAPLFAVRNLRVDSWTGYNLLGNRDGEVLSQDAHRESKVRTKDSLLPSILGYRPQTRVGIDFVRSLDDLKVAWDFVHFRGFLDMPMSLQFTWQGCDSILAAPLVLDLVRWMEEALRRGAKGDQGHLACYFKSPCGGGPQDLVHQYDRLLEHARGPRP